MKYSQFNIAYINLPLFYYIKNLYFSRLSIFDFLLSLDKVQLILIHCDATLSLQRNYEQNTIVSEATLKRILSKAKNIFWEYKNKMNGICIDTSKFTIEDFKAFKFDNVRLVVCTEVYFI